MIDIFLFVYFLHYVTQSVKYGTVIQKIYDTTKKSLEKTCTLKIETDTHLYREEGAIINAYKSGIYQGFAYDGLLSFCKQRDIVISFFYPSGTLVLKDNPLLKIGKHARFHKDFENDLRSLIDIHRGQDIESTYYYGFRQLMEVAIKALNPGINDPGTAILSLQALSDLLAYRLHNHPITYINDDEDDLRIIVKERTFKDIFIECVYPIWDYGKNDRLILTELNHILLELQKQSEHPVINNLFKTVQSALAKQYIEG